MSEKYKISVITPVFQGEKYIEECILNVIRQKDTCIEHIIIDGGSHDRTLEIIKKYAEKYSHIKWNSESDNGQSDAMNKGISLAKGSIIGFLNVDDYYEPHTLHRVMEFFNELPEPSFLVGNCNIWDENNQILAVNRPNNLDFQDLLIGTEIFMFPINPSAYFYHKSLHEIIGLYDINDNFSMDLDFILRAVQVANVIYVDELFGNFRLIPGTKTYEDLQQHGNSRANNLYEKYAAQLKPVDRFWLFFRKKIYYTKFFIRKLFKPVYYFFKDSMNKQR
jgi:glycosyltransferase involved in cell wall biosynthesis